MKLYGITFMSAALIAVSPVLANPMVEGLDLVSSVRVDRTHYDLTYTLRVQTDASSYTSAGYTVTSSAAATVVTKATVTLGALDAGAFVRSTDAFVIRQDRTVLFDSSALRYYFVASPPVSSATGPQIGPATFMERGGRPAHEGYFPIQANSPLAGSTLMLRTEIFGTVTSASYSFVDQLGQIIATGALSENTAPLPWYNTIVQIPSQPFNLKISAVGVNGINRSWTSSRRFVPVGYTSELQPESAFLRKGQSVPVSITLRSVSVTGLYIVSVLLPSGFSGNTGPWTVFLTPGVPTQLTTTVTAPINRTPFQQYTISLKTAPLATPDQSQISNQNIVVDYK